MVNTELVSTFLTFFSAALIILIKFSLAKFLKGWVGILLSFLIAIGLVGGALIFADRCPPMATTMLGMIILLVGLPGVLIVWLAPLVSGNIPLIGGSLLPVVQPLIVVSLILLYISFAEFSLKLFALIGPFIPAVNVAAEIVAIALPFIELVYSGAAFLIMIGIFSSMAGTIPDCFAGPVSVGQGITVGSLK